MSIANAVQRGNYVFLYDENGNQIAEIRLPGGDSPPNGLKSFTSSSVNIQSGGYIFTYNEKGTRTGEMPA